MWRLPGMLGRALQHLPKYSPRGVTPGAPCQDEPQITWSPQSIPVPKQNRHESHTLGVGCGPKYHGWKNAFQWISSRLSCHRMWDAVSWGTLAVLALQLAKQMQFQASLPGFQRKEQSSWHSHLDQIRLPPLLCQDLWLKKNILPTSNSPPPLRTCLEEPSKEQKGPEAPDSELESLASHNSLRTTRLRGPYEAEPVGIAFLDTTGADQHHTTGERLVLEQKETEPLSLEEAMLSLKQQFQLSVSIALNFLGTENMRNGDCEAAYSYFQKAADQGYSKAQFNVGLCHEHGKGTQKDLSKAIFYYQLAAQKGHQMAQYRYARSLLSDQAPRREADKQRAVAMLKQVADAGLKEAQAYLGVLFTKEPFQDDRKAVKYLWLAASNGDSQSKYHLGICYEKGLGVQKNLAEATRYYQQSAALGNEPAQKRLKMFISAELEGTVNLYSLHGMVRTTGFFLSYETIIPLKRQFISGDGEDGEKKVVPSTIITILCYISHFGNIAGFPYVTKAHMIPIIPTRNYLHFHTEDSVGCISKVTYLNSDKELELEPRSSDSSPGIFPLYPVF